MSEAQKSAESDSVKPFQEEWRKLWESFPERWLVLALLAVWVALFHFLGNSTLGYVNTRSLFGWFFWVHTRGAEDPVDKSIDFGKMLNDEEFHAWLIPFVVLGLLWHKREELVAMPKRVWWPAAGLLLTGILLHVLGYMVQQARISVVGLCVGVYGLTGLFWGAQWLRLSLFPFSLLLFCVPLGNAAEALTFPLRMMATNVTAVFCHTVLGINVIQTGAQLSDSAGNYHYEVAAACSGIRSLTAIIAFGVIYSYLTFGTMWRRLLTLAAAFPLAIIANVFRLVLIIVAAEAFGQKAGNYVHESTWFSLAPYVPAIGGMLLLGVLLREKRRPSADAASVPLKEIESTP